MSSIYDYEPLFNGWSIGNLLGAGGFGEVYAIHKQDFGITQYAAVKRISIPSEQLAKDPKLLDRVKSEIQAMIRMKGASNIVTIEEFAIVDWKRGQGRDILIRMELLTSLDSILERETFNIDEAKKLGIHICRALDLCEENNIIHRDIKPANIFRSEHGDYKLGDFGIARTLSDGKASTGIGTPFFMAPEIFRMSKYDLRADVYSLGITLYYLLNQNKMPFEQDSEDFVMRRVDGEPLPPLHGVTDTLMQIVMKACAHQPNSRFNNPTEMLFALENRTQIGSSVYEYTPAPSYNPISPSPIPMNPRVGDEMKFGKYDWRVLDVQGDKALIITKDAIGKRAYHEKKANLTWESCSLRRYLNDEFYKQFTKIEQQQILESRVINSNNLWYGTDGGQDTYDKFFLLSIDETDKYFGNSGDYVNKRRKGYTKWRDNPVPNAILKHIRDGGLEDSPNGNYLTNSSDNARIANYENKPCEYWLRTPGDDNVSAACVMADEDRVGAILVNGHSISSTSGRSGGVRPAMWINLKPILPRPSGQIEIGEIVVFGKYRWKVLDVKNNKIFIISEDIVEVIPFHEDRKKVSWETCTLRKYLNDEFLQKFTNEEQNRIIESSNSNPKNLWHPKKLFINRKDGNDTCDKIFLLSIDEVDRHFGNSGDYKNKRRKRNVKISFATGDGYHLSNIHDSERVATYNRKALSWWLRSSGNSDHITALVCNYGSVIIHGCYNNDERVGVRPALWLTL